MIEARPLSLPGVIEIIPKRFGDERGFFAETFNRYQLAEAGINLDWMQDNQSFSTSVHTLRGLHYQELPFAQAKLVRVLRGRILDVAVDIRKHSPTYRKWVAIELSAEAFNQLLVPIGFAHGFLTLEPCTEVFYKVTAPWSREHDRSIRWDDPEIGVDWRLGRTVPIVSDKDREAPFLADVPPAFIFDANGKYK
ncbi:dTDP-4-dehydrorhamnose 3,5-epimerase [Aurantimonas sp. A2-1-M11]|uniref:dTDP-4-dehydrorhamnose 3,5-epimerase n=1 Tax=Aurantimonas sp. A2-1-M11 TaxID=3113712 RepID=UPI002F957590